MLLAYLLEQTSALHRHLCPRQVLGVRIGLLAGELLGIDLPQSENRLIAFIETDGCFADGLSVATGCWLGHRTLRLMDFGKVAATLVNSETGRAVRIAPHPDVRARAHEYFPRARSRWHAQLEAYQLMPAEELLTCQNVSLNFDLAALLSRPGVRQSCQVCGEEILNEREVLHEGSVLCRACAGEAYYQCAEETGSLDLQSISVEEWTPTRAG